MTLGKSSLCVCVCVYVCVCVAGYEVPAEGDILQREWIQ